MAKEKKFFVQVSTSDLAKEWTLKKSCLSDIGPFVFLSCDGKGVHEPFKMATKFFTPLQILKRVYIGEEVGIFFKDKPPT